MQHMPAKNRKRLILDTLKKKGGIRITELAEDLKKSRMTISRDLNELANSGLLLRVHGGAVTNTSTSYEPPYFTRRGFRNRAKQAIAHLANDFMQRETRFYWMSVQLQENWLCCLKTEKN